MSKRKTKRKSPGPEADRLKIDGNWKKAVKKAVSIERPEGGWPDPDNRAKATANKPKKHSK
ncbi:MAG: hypothetical protein IH885_04715 [Myxococcales bacterium]|nr:hypothetical protein [Myxococcales bacterium]